MERHFVTFLSPGSFVSEQTEKSIASWDIDEAVKMAGNIKERHSARPYGFIFSTRSRGPDDLDSKVTKRSGIYYLGGRIETREQVEARNDPKEEILRSNMRINDIKRVIVNDNSWRFTAWLNDGDTVLDVRLPELV
jgi:hypothetical protein